MSVENIIHIVGKFPGKKVVIMGALHGNEKIGFEVIEQLKKDLNPDKINGEIFLILGNPVAHKNNIRFIDTDLNRLFVPEKIKKLTKISQENLNTEEKRLLEIIPILQEADFLLDIHSTIKPSIPFVFIENTEKHLALAKIFTTDYIVYNSPDGPEDMNTCADNFVNSNGGCGLTYEAGWSEEEGKLAEVLEQVYNFLSATNSFCDEMKKENITKNFPGKILSLQKVIIPMTDNFSFVSDFKNFTEIPANKIFAKDDNMEISYNKNLYLLFVKKIIKKEEVACYLAERI
jgi:succinylglutamate desuccinylase